MKRNGIFFWIGATLFSRRRSADDAGRRQPISLLACYVILQFIVLAVAWSILGGYAGYVNFGTSAFSAWASIRPYSLLKAFGAPLAVADSQPPPSVGALMGFALAS